MGDFILTFIPHSQWGPDFLVINITFNVLGGGALWFSCLEFEQWTVLTMSDTFVTKSATVLSSGQSTGMLVSQCNAACEVSTIRWTMASLESYKWLYYESNTFNCLWGEY